MIRSISVKNFIIIDDLFIEFDKGFNSITGETGTGKSIILDAINFCFGRFNSKTIKKDLNRELSVELVFSKNDECMTIKKVVDLSGKSTCFLNKKQVPAKVIKDLFGEILDITAQMETILSRDVQLEILDRYIISTVQESADLLNDVSTKYSKISKLREEIRDLEERERAARRDHSYYEQIVNELQGLDIKRNEETELLEERSKISRLATNSSNLKVAYDLLRTLTFDSKITQILRNLDRVDSEAARSIKDRLESISIEISDITSIIEELIETSRSKEEELLRIDDRLSIIRTYARKYSTSSGMLFEFLEDTKSKLEMSNKSGEIIRVLEEDLNKTLSEYNLSSKRLHEIRASAAASLSNIVNQKLGDLMMKNVLFKVEVTYSEHLETVIGKDHVEFLANFNDKNAKLLPVAKIASGGEAARLNFALKVSCGTMCKSDTIVFDEIDIGIGGAAAYVMGNAMRNLANEDKMQVIAITHSPQVAARSNTHIVIRKRIDDSGVRVIANVLDDRERIHEIARMISGESVNNEALLAAENLLR